MSLHPHPIPPVPDETARVARAAFPKGNPYICMRDTLGPIFADGDFTDLFPTRGQPAAAPWRLALVTLFQFAEDLSDRQAADWVRALAQPAWVERYHRRSDEYRLPQGQAARHALADQIGADGVALLRAVAAPEAPLALRETPAVETLRRIGVQHYLRADGAVRFRTTEAGIPPASRFVSAPHDADAHLAKKGATCWIGDKVALTETCEDDTPQLITHVETVAGPVADGAMTPRIHQSLKEQDLLPAVHLVDTGFLDAELLVDSRAEYGVELLGPTRSIPRWHECAVAGFGVADFVIDWGEQRAVCPAGHASVAWVPRTDSRGAPSLSSRCSKADCGPCPCRADCTHASDSDPRRSLSIRPREQHEALQERRRLEATPEYARADARRAGVEATLSQGVRRCGLRRSRYLGQERTHLGHVLTGAALNFVRVAAWFAGTPRARTRRSAFVQLMAPTALPTAA
jgi:transposase